MRGVEEGLIRQFVEPGDLGFDRNSVASDQQAVSRRHATPSPIFRLRHCRFKVAHMVALVAEDNAFVMEFVTQALERSGWTILAASSGMQALSLSRNYSGQIDLLLTDFELGDAVNGIELANQVRTARAGIAVLLMSGHLETVKPSEVDFPCLPKPFTADKLIAHVEAAICA